MRSWLHRWLDLESAAVEVEWSGTFAWLWTTLPLFTGLGILAQRHALTSPRRDTLLVVVAVLPWLMQLAFLFPPRRVYSLSLGDTKPWALFRRVLFPGLVFAGTYGLLLHPVEIDIAPFPLVFLVSEMAASGPIADGAFWTVASMGLIAGMDVWGKYNQSYPWYIGLALGWGGGMIVRQQMRLLTELRAAQAGLAARAATDERRRIAREVHDVIAHSLTVMMLHVTGARRALARDPKDASAALEEAERLGRQSLQDVRRVVGILGVEGQEPTPLPGAGDVTALIDRFRGAGATISADISGELNSLEPTAGLALYRIVQESLTNAAKHAPGTSIDIAIVVTGSSTQVRVRNALSDAPKTRSNGLGLWGMRERAALLGGSLHAEAVDGRWTVEAVVPSTQAST